MSRQRLELTGRTFGDLTVLGPAGVNEKGASLWRVRCAHCGRESLMVGYRIKEMSDCGCRHREKVAALSGTYGALTIIRRTGISKDGDAMYLCLCGVCGNEKEIRACTIRTCPKSCGCRMNQDLEKIQEAARKGGARMRDDPEVRAKWKKSVAPKTEQIIRTLDEARREFVHVEGTNVPLVRREEPDKNNRTGARGVYILRRRGKIRYKGRVQIQHEVRYTKEFRTVEEAKAARDELQRQMIKDHGLEEIIWGKIESENE